MNWKFWKKPKAGVEVEAAQKPAVRISTLVVAYKGGAINKHWADAPMGGNPFKAVSDWYETSDSQYFSFEWSNGGFFTLDRNEILYMYTKEE